MDRNIPFNHIFNQSWNHQIFLFFSPWEFKVSSMTPSNVNMHCEICKYPMSEYFTVAEFAKLPGHLRNKVSNASQYCSLFTICLRRDGNLDSLPGNIKQYQGWACN